MFTKAISLILHAYLVSKASYPPSTEISTKKVISTEGLIGLAVGNFVPKSMILFIIIQTLTYIYLMVLQTNGSISTLNHKLYEWSLLEIILFCLSIVGTSLRLWCFKCLNEYFTFNITIRKNHKLITTGPYSLLVHPSYTGGTLMIININFLWYQLCSYIQNFSPSRLGSFILLIGWGNIIAQSIFLGLVYKRVPQEENLLKSRFGKEWDTYFSQRKRFIPYVY